MEPSHGWGADIIFMPKAQKSGMKGINDLRTRAGPSRAAVTRDDIIVVCV